MVLKCAQVWFVIATITGALLTPRVLCRKLCAGLNALAKAGRWGVCAERGAPTFAKGIICTQQLPVGSGPPGWAQAIQQCVLPRYNPKSSRCFGLHCLPVLLFDFKSAWGLLMSNPLVVVPDFGLPICHEKPHRLQASAE